MPLKIGIIGFPIRHSISPAFQQAALDHYGIDARYQPWEVDPKDLGAFMESIRAPDAIGNNVTVPHKEAVMEHLDEVEDWARQAGAVNTVVNQNGKLVGHNTDGVGFLRGLTENSGFTAAGARVVIFGAGGSAKAVALALAGEGVSSITIVNRTLERAERLAELIASGGPSGLSVDAVPLDDEDRITRAAAESSLLVNSTSMGMLHGPDEPGSPIQARHIPTGVVAYDLVYNPSETPFLREAAKAGAVAIGGLSMLVHQGARAFELWTGKEAPVQVMMSAAVEAMSGTLTPGPSPQGRGGPN